MSYPLEKILLPMGAKEVKDEKKMEALWDDDNYVAEEKYDGSRYLSVGGRFFSRRVSDVTHFPVEKTGNVPHLVTVLNQFPNLILDGEVYYEGMSSNDVTSIMGALPDKAIARQEERGKLKYVAFDILRDIDGTWLIDEPWIARRAKLLRVYADICMVLGVNVLPNIELSRVETDDKRGFYAEIIAKGGEGVILKNKTAKYIPEKKPMWNWVKVKKHITVDVVIIGFKPAVKEYEGDELDTWNYWEREDGSRMLRYEQSGKSLKAMGYTPVTKFYFYNWIGAVTFGQWKTDYVDPDGNRHTEEQVLKYLVDAVAQGYSVTFEELTEKLYVPDTYLVELGYFSGINEELRADMSANPDKYIGDCVEIGAMEMTKDGFYRHPVFSRLRPDKNPSECVIGA